MSDFPTSIITNQTFLEVVLLRLEQILCSEVLSYLLLKNDTWFHGNGTAEQFI